MLSLLEICVESLASELSRSPFNAAKFNADVIALLPPELAQQVVQALVARNRLTRSMLNLFAKCSLWELALPSSCSAGVDDSWLHFVSRHFQTLIRLDLSGCAGVSDAGIGHLRSLAPSLTWLSVDRCVKLTDDAVDYILELHNLTYLSLEGCKGVSNKGVARLSALKHLRHISLEQCTKLIKVEPLADLSGLVTLSLSYCIEITDANFEPLTRLTGLTSLKVARTKLTDASFEGVARMPRLQHLNAAGTGLGDRGARALSALKGLTELNLESTGLTNEGLSALSALPSLTSLNLAYTHINDAGLGSLSKLVSIKALCLESCDLTDAGMVHLRPLVALARLDLADTEITSAGMAHLAPLTALEVSGGERRADRGLPARPRLKTRRGVHASWNMKRLRALNLDARNVSDGCLAHLACLPALRELDLFAARISDAGLEHLARLAPLRDLESLELCGGALSDAGVARHLPRLSRLSSLNLSQNYRLSDACVPALGRLPLLTALNLSHTRLTSAGALQLASSLPQLQTLSLFGCKVSKSALSRAKHPPSLSVHGAS
eukprot:tig00021070_g17923.t1